MKIQEITWQQALPVRHKVLWPEKPMAFCQVDGDETGLHYGVFIDDALVCAASVYLDGMNARLRKFATLPEYQGQGLGSKVIGHVIGQLQSLKVSYFWCDARTSAEGFYQKFGMKTEGAEFDKSGIAYYKMAVKLR
mgnify:CR=1 FL=1